MKRMSTKAPASSSSAADENEVTSSLNAANTKYRRSDDHLPLLPSQQMQLGEGVALEMDQVPLEVRRFIIRIAA